MIVELFDFGDAERVVAKLTGVEEQAHPRLVHHAFVKIGFEMREATKELFAAQGRRGGTGWKKLAESTVERKGNERILFTKGSYPGYESGKDYLYGSLTGLYHRYQVFEFHGYELQYGTSRPWAYTHMTGDRPDLPARPFLRFMKSDVERWRFLMVQHLLKPWLVKATPSQVRRLWRG